MTTFAPTAEQQAALDLFATGKSLAIEAGAGTGKTSTLVLLARSTSRRGQYVAFNKAIVEESKTKMPDTVACHTAHALAFRAVGKNYKARLNAPRMRSLDIAARLRIEPLRVTTQDGERKLLSASYLAGLAISAVVRFCQSADDAPAASHVPYVRGIDIPPGRMDNNRILRQHIAPAVRRAWDDIQKTNGTLPFRHDYYLKLWQLSHPRIGADYILFDEAQDANPVMVAVVAAQTHAQLVWVGDSQQQIYSFTGAVNALESVPADARTFLTQSFRFGPAIAAVANRVLDDLDADLRLAGTDSIPSTVAPVADPDVILTRTNAAAVRVVLNAIRAGKRPHVVGGAADVVSFAKAARTLKEGGRTEHPELACFDSWNEVVEYVEQDEQGGDLRLLVALIDEFGVDVILEALDHMASEASADVVVSTAHKSKGREWNTVRLGEDFPENPVDEELRLLYVACTRAKMTLDLTAVDYLTRDDEEPSAVVSAVVPAPVDAPAPAAPPAAAVEAKDAPSDHSVAEHLAGVAGVFDLWGDGLLLGQHADSRAAIETASTLYRRGRFAVVAVYDNRTGSLVVQYEA